MNLEFKVRNFKIEEVRGSEFLGSFQAYSMDGVSPVDVSIDDFVKMPDEYKHEHLLVCM